MKRAIIGHWNTAAALVKMAVDNKIEAYNIPQGTLLHLFRAIAGHKAGVITNVGLETFVDPRNSGGRLNARTAAFVSVSDRSCFKIFPYVCGTLNTSLLYNHNKIIIPDI